VVNLPAGLFINSYFVVSVGYGYDVTRNFPILVQ